MKAMILNYRYWVLCIMAMVTFLLMISEPTDESNDWLRDVAIIKLSAATLAAATYALYRYWADRGKMNEIKHYIDY